MRIVFIGSGDFALPTLRSLHAAGHEIPCVITQPDRPSGRGRRLTPTPVKRVAAELRLETVATVNINDTDLVADIRAHQVEVGVVVAFGQKISQAFRDAMPGGCINLHASLLPKYRGAAPFQWAVINGEKTTGVTVFKLVDRMDAGPILHSIETPIGETETAAELHDRLAELGPAAVRDALSLFAGRTPPDGTTQDDAQATPAPKLKKEDGRIRFDESAAVLAQRINGLWSWPGATCRLVSADGARDETVILARARASDTTGSEGEPATLNEDLHVTTSDGSLEVIEIKPASGKRMSWSAYVNGRQVRPGDRFVPML